MILREFLTFVANILRFETDDEEEKLPTICRGWCDCCCEHRIIIVVVFVAVNAFFKSFARRYMHTRKAFNKKERKKGRKRVLFAQIQKSVNCATRNALSLSLSLSLSQTLSPRVVVGALFIFCGACSHSSSLNFEKSIV